MGLSKARRLVCTLLVLAAAGSACVRTAAQDLPRPPRSPPVDTRPIVIDADEVATWMENGQRILLLKGHVLVQQGGVQSRFDQGVVWADTAGFQRSRTLRVDVYAEGNVYLEKGGEPQRGPQALFDLSTRGDFKLNSHKSKVVQQPRPDDPLYQRALAGRSQPAAPPPPAAIPPPGSAPETAADPGLKPAQFSGQQQPSRAKTRPTQERRQPRDPPATDTETAPPPRPLGAGPRPGPGPLRQFSIAPRTGQPYQARIETSANGEQALVVTGGVILQVRDAGNIGLLDIEADRLVLWTRGSSPLFFENLRTPQGQFGHDLEFYLAGNVEIRQQSPATKEVRTLRAAEIYYDVSRHVAIALSADLEFKQPGLLYPVHMKSDELLQLSETQFEAVRAVIFASRLPSDPGLTVYLSNATLEEKKVAKRTLFGTTVLDPKTGQPQTEPQSIVRGTNVFFQIEDVPVFYLPFIQGDARDPLGPIQGFSLGFNRIFGFQAGTSLDIYDLVGIEPIPGTRWRWDLDYMSKRGPGTGTEFDYAGNKYFGIPARYNGVVKAWGLRDVGEDVLGGSRGENDDHPLYRGRFFWRQALRELPGGFQVQSQVAALSDRNFLEQFFKPEFDLEYNQATFLYVKQQHDQWAWTVLTESRLFDWMTHTQWLPRGDGYLLGQSFFERFTYNAWANAAYAQLRPAEEGSPPLSPTDVRLETGRFDLLQELSLPFYVGPFRVVPYGLLDLTHYSRDLTEDDANRVYGGGGVRASIPFSQLYPNVQSLLWNLNGIYHKIDLSANYYAVETNVPFSQLPQLDRLNDDATDQALRDITPFQPNLNPSRRDGTALATLPLFDPQTYAIRRLVLNRVDTRDDIEVVELYLRQRWQTKRGYPGQQHVLDWMRLDLSGSYFPQSERDNFGEPFAFLEYAWLWNIGDRTTLASSGWVDPIDFGARVFTAGAFLNRPDRTNFFAGYRQIDPVNSKAVTGAVTYVFSPKYAVTGSSTYDFGTNQSLSNTLVVTRVGKDLQVGVGVTYNVLQNNFGLLVQVLPNLAAQRAGNLVGLPTRGGGGGIAGLR